METRKLKKIGPLVAESGGGWGRSGHSLHKIPSESAKRKVLSFSLGYRIGYRELVELPSLPAKRGKLNVLKRGLDLEPVVTHPSPPLPK